MKPGKYEAKNSSFREYVKVLLFGAGWPWGMIGVILLAGNLAVFILKALHVHLR